ncbi:hypothetical protein [Hymenobacter nivis]|uniref:DUF3078 domain-containing protein n=1 Tax=Hymenobacter nivis TaxID=1850093 RepID=A0A502G7Z4_9BACT|nr:hypothetical protein [Hymenobacter nivis]TPG58008.1 hypothetical protein EAH73_22710 [Hymenobacter nivis]
MKHLYLALLLSLCAQAVFAQNQPSRATPKVKTKPPLPPKEFDAMIIQDITYTIAGESTPTSGLKIDVTKPEATVSGAFPTPNLAWADFISFDLKAGATNGNINLLKGYTSVNTGFEFRPALHYIPAVNKAKYGSGENAKTNAILVNARHDITLANKKASRDSLLMMALLRDHHLSKVESIPPVIPADSAVTPQQKKILIHFIETYTKKTNLGLSEASSVDTILAKAPVADTITTVEKGKSHKDIKPGTFLGKLVDDYAKRAKQHKNLDKNTSAELIKNAADIWTQKNYFWITVSPFARSTKLELYHTQFENKDSSYIKSEYKFFFGLTGYLNFYRVNVNKRAHFFRLGVTAAKDNNLNTLNSFNYENTRPFYAYGTNVTVKTKEGTAYNEKALHTGLVGQFNVDYYNLPLNSFVPGFYISSTVNLGNVYNLNDFVGRENDSFVLGLEGGPVLNIKSREKDKDKNILSILLYLRYEDLTDQRRTSKESRQLEPIEDFRKRNLSVGLRLGIPITLPQRSS